MEGSEKRCKNFVAIVCELRAFVLLSTEFIKVVEEFRVERSLAPLLILTLETAASRNHRTIFLPAPAKRWWLHGNSVSELIHSVSTGTLNESVNGEETDIRCSIRHYPPILTAR